MSTCPLRNIPISSQATLRAPSAPRVRGNSAKSSPMEVCPSCPRVPWPFMLKGRLDCGPSSQENSRKRLHYIVQLEIATIFRRLTCLSCCPTREGDREIPRIRNTPTSIFLRCQMTTLKDYSRRVPGEIQRSCTRRRSHVSNHLSGFKAFHTVL